MADKKARYTREQLLQSKRYAGYQHDFLSVVLCRETYTIKEADAAVKAFFGSKNKKESD